jgi:radical SAM-linked protein
MRFLSHLELARTMTRAFRRGEVPLSHTEGFHPMPRLSFASALSVGIESTGEFLDFETMESVDLPSLQRRVNESLPAGIGLDEVAEVEAGAPSLGELVNAARYVVRLDRSPAGRPLGEDLRERMVASPRRVVTRERKGQVEELDILPSILRIDANDSDGIEMVIRIGSTGSARPDDVVRGLYGAEASAARIVRRDLLVVREEEMISPMDCRRLEKPALTSVPVSH